MGCGSSDLQPGAIRPIILSNQSVPQQIKDKLIICIQHDNLPGLAILLQQHKIKVNSQISDEDLFWTPIHFCCRYDAVKCLEYLLKQFYSEQPKNYIKFVNSKTVDGHTCLHICAIWNSQKCFILLNNLGGLHFEIKDKRFKDAFMTAADYKRQNMVKILSKYREMKIQITSIQHEKLISEDIEATEATSEAGKIREAAIDVNTAQAEQQEIKNILDKITELQLANDKLKEKLKIEKKQQNKQENKQKVTDDQNLSDSEQQQEQAQIIDELVEKQIIRNERTIQDLKKKKNQIIQKQEQVAMNLQNKQFEKKVQYFQQKKAARKKKKQKFISVHIAEVQAVKQQHFEIAPQANASQTKLIGTLPPQFKSIYNQAQQVGVFTDSSFPPALSSYGSVRPNDSPRNIEKNKKFHTQKKSLIWLRPSQIFKGQYKLFDDIKPEDIDQEQLGVCYYLATLSALARQPRNILNLFHCYDKQLGFYVVRLYIGGIPKLIVVDDNLPCNKRFNAPYFTKPIGNEIWVQILVKAWAKQLGSYLQAQGMHPLYMMQNLTGAPSQKYSLTDNKQLQKNIDILFKHSTKDYYITLVSMRTGKIEGIVNNHVYSLMQTYKYKNQKLFKIRNPWGRVQWSGKYGDNSQLWTQELNTLVNQEKGNDGIFICTQNELPKCFCDFTISMVKPYYKYNYKVFDSQIKDDVFFTFYLDRDNQTNIKIAQPFNRMIDDDNYEESPVIVEIGKILNDKVQYLSEGETNSKFGKKSINVSNNVMPKYTKGTYFVRIRMKWKNVAKYNTAVIASYSQSQIQFKQISDKQGYQLWQKMMIYKISKEQLKTSSNKKIRYGKCWFKGQWIFYAQTDQEKPIEVRVVKQKGRVNMIADYNRDGEDDLKFTITKEKPGIGSLAKQNLKGICKTGIFTILSKQIQ